MRCAEQFTFAAFINRVDDLLDAVCRGITRRHLNFFRMMQKVRRKLANVVREGCGEQQRLALLRQHRKYFAHIANKAHIEHAICLIQNEHVHVRQIDGSLVDVIEQTARRCDNYIDAFVQFLLLRIDTDAAKYHHRLKQQVAAVITHTLINLRGQLAGGGEYQDAHTSALPFHTGILQMLQQWQRESGCLAGSGLCARQYSPCQQGRVG